MVPVATLIEGSAVDYPIVVLLGAGASRDAGLRLATELTEDLRDYIERDNDRELQKALGLILGGLALRRGIEGQRFDAVPDIEMVLRVAQFLEDRMRHPLADYVASWHTALERLSPGGDGVIFGRLVSRARSILQEVLKVPDEVTRYKYLADICKIGRPLRISVSPLIFTLNYDLCVEKALDYENRIYTTGFKDGLWSASQFDQPNVVQIYKLHGSFGWVRHPQTRLLYDRTAAYQRDDIAILSDDTPDELIFGTDNKLRAVQPFLWMVYRLTQAVEKASYIVTIGYGYGDEYINQIIGQGMASDEKKRLVIVGPGLDARKVEAAPGMAFFPNRVSFLPDKAKKALHEEDTILRHLADLESATRTNDPFAEDT